MVGNIIAWLLLVLLVLVFAWLTRRAWRSRRLLVKLGGSFLAALLTLLLTAVAALAAIGLYQFYAPTGGPVQDLKVEVTPQRVARGQHIASMFCVGCHSTTGEFPLTGGSNLGKEIPIPLGDFVSMNLTPAGSLKNWSDGQILRILREGVSPDGHTLLVMGAVQARHMSDEDLYSVIAFLRSQAPAGEPTMDPPDAPTLIGAIFAGAGMVPREPPVTGPVVAPPRAETAEYGKYVVSFSDCQGCHGPEFIGGAGGLLPKGPNLRFVKAWTREQFLSTIRTGTDPSGHHLSDQMPWKTIARMDDDELGAIYAYLVSLASAAK